MSIDEALEIKKYRNRRRLVPGQSYSGIVTFGHERLPWLWRHGLVPRDVFTFAFCRNPYDRAVSMWLFNNKRNGYRLTFPEFCRNWDNWIWRITSPQARWLDGVALNFLGRFENLQPDFDRLCDALGVERRPLPHINPTRHGPAREYYTDETQVIVQERWARDFERFSYGKELPDG